MNFEALVTSEPRENADGQTLVFDFISPESLKGLEVRISGTDAEIGLNGKQFADISLPKNKSSGLFGIAEMLSPSEPILNIKSKSGQDYGMPEFDNLTVVSTPQAILYIDPESGFPAKATTPNGEKSLIINVIPTED